MLAHQGNFSSVQDNIATCESAVIIVADTSRQGDG